MIAKKWTSSKGNDVRIVIRLGCSSLKSQGRSRLTRYETGFVTVTLSKEESIFDSLWEARRP